MENKTLREAAEAFVDAAAKVLKELLNDVIGKDEKKEKKEKKEG